MVKGIFQAGRSVGCTFILLTGIVYVLAIALRQLSDGKQVGDIYFKSVPGAMYTVFVRCALLDGPAIVLEDVMKESIICTIIIGIAIMGCALVMMNMLVGVLVEVVSAVAAAEKEAMTVSFVKEKVLNIMETSGLDQNNNGKVSKNEFECLLVNERARVALRQAGVDPVALVDFAD